MWTRLRTYGSFVRFSHSVFALPFAYVGAFLAVDGYPGTSTLAWLTLAMVGARTLAMALNRLVDAELDVVRHFTTLSQKNFCVDANFYPLGSCTMKLNAATTRHLYCHKYGKRRFKVSLSGRCLTCCPTGAEEWA